MRVFGITGLLGCGKSSASAYIKSKGFPVIDADEISKLVMDKNTDEGKGGFEKVYRVFGATVLDKLGNLDRTALRKRIVMNPHEREQLEEILHPLMNEYLRKVMTSWKSKGVSLGFIEGARLYESGFDKAVFEVIQVSAPEELRVKRLLKRDSMGKDEVKMMVQMQEASLLRRFLKREWKNDKKLSDLEKQVDTFIDEQSKLVHA